MHFEFQKCKLNNISISIPYKITAVSKLKEKQSEVMKKLKTDYASKLNNLKQAKRALQAEDFNKENIQINNIGSHSFKVNKMQEV